MPFISPTSTCSGGQPNVDNIYLLKGQQLPSNTALTSPVPVNARDNSRTAEITVVGATATDQAYVGAINITPGLPASQAVTTPGNGVAIRTIAGAAPTSGATVVDIGANAQGPNYLYVSGALGSSEVYNPKYNQVIKGTPLVDVQTSLDSSAPGTATRQFQFQAPTTGAYMVQIDINLYNADVVPTVNTPILDAQGQVIGGLIQAAGAIEWTVTTLPPLPAGEIQYMSSTIAGTDLIKQNQLSAVAEPMDYTTSNMGFLLAAGNYNINLFAIKPNPDLNVLQGNWNLSNIKVRLVQMC